MSQSRPPSPSLQALLEESPPIADAGFSARVMRALPARRRTNRAPYAIVASLTALACAIAYAVGGSAVGARGAGAHGAFALMTTTSYVGLALALFLVASTTLFTAED